MKRETIALAATLLMAGAPAQADGKSSNWIRVQSLATGGSLAKGTAPDDGWIEINGWDWEVEAARRVGPSDVTMKRGTAPAPSPPPPPAGPVPVPYPDGLLDYDEGDTGTHAGPAHPPDEFGRVKVQFQWSSCVRGRRLPSIELRDGRITAWRLLALEQSQPPSLHSLPSTRSAHLVTFARYLTKRKSQTCSPSVDSQLRRRHGSCPGLLLLPAASTAPLPPGSMSATVCRMSTSWRTRRATKSILHKS